MSKKLTKDEMREYQRQRRAQAKDVKPDVKPISDVKPTMADVAANKAWVVLSGPNKGELVWHGPLAQSWKNVPCQVVDGVCVAAHHDGQHEVASQEAPVSLPLVRFLKADPRNLSKLQRIAGSLGKLAGEVRFGIDGPTFEDLGETIGVKPPIHAK